MPRHDSTPPGLTVTAPSLASQAGHAGQGTLDEAAGHAVPLDRLSPLAAVAAWLAIDPRPDLAVALVAVIRTDTRIELDPDEVSAVLRDARGEGLDAETTFERLILQGEWLSMDRLARIRPR